MSDTEKPLLLTPEQVLQITVALRAVCHAGFGRVVIQVEKGRPAWLEIAITGKFKKKGCEHDSET